MTTETQEPIYSRLFYNGALHLRDEWYGFFLPEDVTEPEIAQNLEENAARVIQSLEESIAQLQAYRIDMASRYQELVTRPTLPRVRLTRRTDWYSGKIFYDLDIYDVYADNPEIQVNTKTTTWPGKQHRDAIRAYRDYIRLHPGIHAETNVPGL